MDSVHDKLGKLKEEVGWATGDREVEAEGQAEQDSGHDPSRAEVEEETDEVRREHGDLGT